MFSSQTLPLPKSRKGTRQKAPAATQVPEADDDGAQKNAPLRKQARAKKRKASLEQVTSHSKVIPFTDRIGHYHNCYKGLLGFTITLDLASGPAHVQPLL